MTRKAEPETTVAKERRIYPGRIVLLGFFVAALLAIHLLGLGDYLSFHAFVDQHERLVRFAAEKPWLAIGLYCSLYIAVAAFAIPGAAVLTVAGGLLFGWVVAGLITILSATLGAMLLFLSARRLCAGVLTERAGRIARLARGFQEDGFHYLLLMRLAPIFPFFAVTLAAALFRLSLGTFVAATLIGIAPGSLAYAWLGSGFGEALDRAAAMKRTPELVDFLQPGIFFGLIALSAIAALPLVYRKLGWRRVLGEEDDNGADQS